MTPELEQKQWDLTNDEVIELHARWIRKMGAWKLLAELQQLKGFETEQESAWWEQVCSRIPKEYRHRLVASFELQKVWVAGEVPELDDKHRFHSKVDNPSC